MCMHTCKKMTLECSWIGTFLRLFLLLFPSYPPALHLNYYSQSLTPSLLLGLFLYIYTCLTWTFPTIHLYIPWTFLHDTSLRSFFLSICIILDPFLHILAIVKQFLPYPPVPPWTLLPFHCFPWIIPSVYIFLKLFIPILASSEWFSLIHKCLT